MVGVTAGVQIWGSTNYTTPAIHEYTIANPCGLDIALSPQTNMYPVVTYSSNYDCMDGGIIVAWTYNDNYLDDDPAYPPQKGGMEPIAMNCDHSGIPISMPNYWMLIPFGPFHAYPPFQNTVAVTGRDNVPTTMGNILYAWDDWGPSKIDNKSVPWVFPWLRVVNNEPENKIVNSIYPNPSNGNFVINIGTEKGESVCIEIYNTLGEKVYNSVETSSTENYTKEVSIKEYGDGIYFVREVGTLSNNNWKIILAK